MKTTFFILVLTWFGVAALTAQVGGPKPGATDATDGSLRYEEIARDAHSRVWSRVSYETNVLGEAVATTILSSCRRSICNKVKG